MVDSVRIGHLAPAEIDRIDFWAIPEEGYVGILTRNETDSFKDVPSLLLRRMTTGRRRQSQQSESLTTLDGFRNIRGRLWGA